MRYGSFGAAAGTLLWVCSCASGGADPAGSNGNVTIQGAAGGASNLAVLGSAGLGAAGSAGMASANRPAPTAPTGTGSDVKPTAPVGGAAGMPTTNMPAPATPTPTTPTPTTPGANAGSGGSAAPANPGMPAPSGKGDPVVPAVSGECPAFRNGTITLMGVGGIAVQAGSKPSSASAPMVFYWHGTGGLSGEYATQASAVHRGVIAEGGVLVSFQDTSGGDLLSGTFIFGAGDFKISDQLVACAVKDANVDPRRIFATGCSAGGLFSAAMAAERSNYLAAAAPNSGGWTVPVVFQNKYTPALMTIHGAAGVDVVVVDFSVTSKTADDAFKARGGFVINCDHGGFHCGGGSLAPDIWTFFKAHPYGVDPQPWKGGLPAGFNRACKLF